MIRRTIGAHRAFKGPATRYGGARRTLTPTPRRCIDIRVHINGKGRWPGSHNPLSLRRRPSAERARHAHSVKTTPIGVQPPLFRSTIIPCREIGYWGLALPLRTPRLLRPHWWGQTESQSSDNGRFDVAAGARLQAGGTACRSSRGADLDIVGWRVGCGEGEQMGAFVGQGSADLSSRICRGRVAKRALRLTALLPSARPCQIRTRDRRAWAAGHSPASSRRRSADPART